MSNYSRHAEHRTGQHRSDGDTGAGMQDESRVSVYVEVDDPQKYLDRAARAGATVLMPVTTITADTTIAMFRDPAGNVNGILKAGAPAQSNATSAAGRVRKTTTRKKTTARRKSTSAGSRKKTTARRARRR